MNSIRHFLVAGSLLCASLVPSAADAMTTSTSSGEGPTPAAVAPGATGANRGHSGAPFSSGLLALGSANDGRTVHSGGGPADDASLAQREQAAPELRDFRGGRVYVYLGGGATLILVLILLLILL